MAKKKDTTPKTKAPSGLKISRSGSKFIFSWTIPSGGYEKQEYKWYINGQRADAGRLKTIKENGKNNYKNVPVAQSVPSGWSIVGYIQCAGVDLSIGHTKTKMTETVDLTSGVSSIGFAVRGKKKKYTKDGTEYKPTWSDWKTETATISLPKTPSVSCSVDTDLGNSATFSWEVADADSQSMKIFKRVEYQTTLSVNTTSPSWPSAWTSSTNATGTFDPGGESFNFDTDKKTLNSYTRHFRVRSYGPKGYTSPVSSSHTYAYPFPVKDVHAQLYKMESANGYQIRASWDAPESATHPVESSQMEYRVTNPTITRVEDTENDRVISRVELPSDSNWTTVQTLIRDTRGARNSGVIFLDGSLNHDEVVYLRINTLYDGGKNYYTKGDPIPVLLPGSEDIGSLPDPNVPVGSITRPSSDGQFTVTATNGSDIQASVIAIHCREKDTTQDDIIGMKLYGQTSWTGRIPNYDPEKEYSIGLQTIVGDYYPRTEDEENPTIFTVTKIYMKSGTIWGEGLVPIPPKDVKVTSVPADHKLIVSWDWTWLQASEAELSWANHDDAWESTSEPTYYSIKDGFPTVWNISDLEADTWYVRVRLNKDDGESVVKGGWSNPIMATLSSAPTQPTLYVRPDVITKDDNVNCYWSYTSVDDSPQNYAEICEVQKNQDGTWTYGLPFIRTADNEQHLSFRASEIEGFSSGTHYLAVRTCSKAGERSEGDDGWSEPCTVDVVEPLIPIVSIPESEDSPFQNIDVTIDNETETVFSLVRLPFDVEISGTGTDSDITVIVERAVDYFIDRPDDNDEIGYAGETIATGTRHGDGIVTISKDDCIGSLDDDAVYNIIVTASDQYKQSATSDPISFTVHWEHQALIPSAEITIDDNHKVIFITPIIPADDPEDGNILPEEGDRVDIYRLSTDAPELILKDGLFYSTYVDLYPTLGDTGGYRIVYKTVYGDYIIENGPNGRQIAWYDTKEESADAYVDLFALIINFGKDEVVLPYDISGSHSWKKDFQLTHYLGGNIIGDWNPGVERSSSFKTRVAVEEDPGLITKMRLLADYPGACHVRTPDGSSFTANVDVTEDREEKWVSQLASFSLNITRIASEGDEMILMEQWEAQNGE